MTICRSCSTRCRCSTTTHPRRPLAASVHTSSVPRIPRTFLALGSAMMAFIDPRRGGKNYRGFTLINLRDAMLGSCEGRRILKDRPRVNTNTLNMEKLRSLPDNTFGKAYTRWLEACKINPIQGSRSVHYIDDPELAYVMQRYRETHDLYHALFALKVSAMPELVLKAFEFANLGFPMAALALGASINIKPPQRERLWREFVPWAVKCGSSARCLITVYWEERWEQDMD
ncbi:ubiquinone biosynthesis protein COQ4, mitochondrial [Pisolithus albus]|nr:ubiquinone biosynthesis protein COQ4, mitochondrial [Pisolithus albus]